MKKVFLKTRFRGSPLHSLYDELIRFPPEGFEVVVDKMLTKTRSNLIYYVDKCLRMPVLVRDLWYDLRPLLYLAYRKADRSASSTDSDLVFAVQQLIFDKVSWIVDLEYANSLVGYGNISLYRSAVEKVLNSNFCKMILPWSDWSKTTLYRSLDHRRFEEKVEIVHLAVRAKNFTKQRRDEHLRLLFIGSTNPTNIYNFEFKGGIEVLESFVELSKKYDRLELVVRSWVPKKILAQYSENDAVKFYPYSLNASKLEQLYASSDILVFPSHANLGITILEAMSYELPVVALRVYDVPEAVEEMKTGILINPSPEVPYYTLTGGPNHYSRRFYAGIRHTRPWLVKELVNKLSLLIEDETMRRRMGYEGRKIVETGNFSISYRNERLREIFQKALMR